MMNIDLFDTFLNLHGLEMVLQAFLAFVLFIYLIYAFLLVRQVRLLNKSFKTEASFALRSFAYGLFLATLLLLLFTVATIL